MSSSDHVIHYEVFDIAGKKLWLMTVIYPHNQPIKRKFLWMDLKQIARHIHDPWMILGDFNNVLTVADMIGGNHVQVIELEELENMMRHASIYEHETKGAYFAWSNRHASGTIYSRIDRAICNRSWFLQYSECEIEVMTAHISYHYPLKLKPLGHQIC